MEAIHVKYFLFQKWLFRQYMHVNTLSVHNVVGTLILAVGAIFHGAVKARII